MVVNDEDPRVLTQLLVGGSDTVVATYAAPADESYDPRQANAVIEAILARQLESAA